MICAGTILHRLSAQSGEPEEVLVQKIAITAALLLLPVSLRAQWLDFPTPGIPRTADGKPNLTAPLPRTPEGKPDLSGIWQVEINPYRFSLTQDLKDEAIFRPAAQAVLTERNGELATCRFRSHAVSAYLRRSGDIDQTLRRVLGNELRSGYGHARKRLQ